MNKIFFSNPRINTKNTLSIIKKALKKSFPNEGDQTIEFEKKLKKLLKVKYVVTTNSGTVALFLALKANDIKKGDEVILPSFTIISCILPVIRAKAKPVLIDSDPVTWNMNVDQIEKKISKKKSRLSKRSRKKI